MQLTANGGVLGRHHAYRRRRDSPAMAVAIVSPVGLAAASRERGHQCDPLEPNWHAHADAFQFQPLRADHPSASPVGRAMRPSRPGLPTCQHHFKTRHRMVP